MVRDARKSKAQENAAHGDKNVNRLAILKPLGGRAYDGVQDPCPIHAVIRLLCLANPLLVRPIHVDSHASTSLRVRGAGCLAQYATRGR